MHIPGLYHAILHVFFLRTVRYKLTTTSDEVRIVGYKLQLLIFILFFEMQEKSTSNLRILTSFLEL